MGFIDFPMVDVSARAAASAAQSTANAAIPKIGVTDGSSAAAGVIGEYKSATLASAAINTTAFYALTSITLTAGDWDVGASYQFFSTAAGTNFAQLIGGTSLVGTTTDSNADRNVTSWAVAGVTIGNNNEIGAVTRLRRVSVTVDTPVYLMVRAIFTGGTASVGGTISARRVH